VTYRHLGRDARPALRPRPRRPGRADQDQDAAVDVLDAARHRRGDPGRHRPVHPERPPQSRLVSRASTPPTRRWPAWPSATLAIGVFGVLSVTGEYGTGTIRSSLSRRTAPSGCCSWERCSWWGPSPWPWARSSSSPPSGSARPSWPTAPAVRPPRPARGAARRGALGAFLALLGLLGLGLGVIIRHTAGAIAAYRRDHLPAPPPPPAVSRHSEPVHAGGDPGQLGVGRGPQPQQVSAPVGFLLMVLYCAVVLGLGRP
jgi:hypothetical protein